MNNAFLHFKSQTPFRLSINGEDLEYVDNIDTHSIDILLNKTTIYVTYSPISTSTSMTIPYTFKISNYENITIDSEYVEVVPFPNNNYDILLSPFIYENITSYVNTYSTSIKDYSIDISSLKTTSILKVLYKNEIILSKNTPSIAKAYSEIKNNHLIIEGETNNNKIYTIIINTSKNIVIFDSIVDSIKEDNNTIKLLENSLDLVGHAKLYTIDLESSNTDTSIVYIESNKPKDIKTREFIPYAFLECIKQENYNYSKSYLDEKINNVTNQHFKEYFGKISKIYYNTHNLDNNIENYTIKSNNTYKNYNFMLNNNKIKDIEEVF